MVATRKALNASPRLKAMPRPCVSVANGPITFSGPSATNKNVNASPSDQWNTAPGSCAGVARLRAKAAGASAPSRAKTPTVVPQFQRDRMTRPVLVSFISGSRIPISESSHHSRGSEFLLDDPGKRSQSWHEQIFAALHRNKCRKIEQERLFGAGHRHLRTFTAGAIDRILLARIESDELASLHPFFLDEFELPFDIGLDEQVDQPAIDTIVLKRTILKMRAVLDAPTN